MMRKKPLSKLRKRLHEKNHTIDKFMMNSDKSYFLVIDKKDLTIQQTKVIHKNVLRKKEE